MALWLIRGACRLTVVMLLRSCLATALSDSMGEAVWAWSTWPKTCSFAGRSR
jgi:hypothetical protein